MSIAQRTPKQIEDWIGAYERDDAERKERREAEDRRRAAEALFAREQRARYQGREAAISDTAGVQFTNLWDHAVERIIHEIIEAAKPHVPAHALPDYLRSLKGRFAPRVSMRPDLTRPLVVTTVVVPEIVISINVDPREARDSGRRDIKRRAG